MENIESLLNEVSLSGKQKKIKYQKQAMNTYENSVSQKINVKGLFLDQSPLSPVFKPLQSPNDILPEINLPVCDLSTDGSVVDSISSNNKYKKTISVSSECQLNISLDNNANSEFNLAEDISTQEGALDKSNHTETVNHYPQRSTSEVYQPRNLEGSDQIRRSHTENITISHSIFQFLEKGALLQKRAF